MRRLWVTLIAACGGDSDGYEPFEPTPKGQPVSTTLGAAGGAATIGRLTLTVPAGALASDTTLTMQELDMPGAWGWRFEPSGTTFAMPVEVKLAFTTDELGMPTEIRDDDNLRLEAQVPLLGGVNVDSTSVSDVELAARWSEGQPMLEYVGHIEHFSELMVQEYEGFRVIYPNQVTVGQPFTVAIVADDDRPYNVSEAYLWCDSDPLRRYFKKANRNEIRTIYVTSERPGVFTELTPAMPVTAPGISGFQKEARCNVGGRHRMVALAGLTVKREDGVPLPAGCDIRGATGPEVPVQCIGACTGSDPADVYKVQGGHWSLDLICYETGIGTDGRPWIRVSFLGPWLPDPKFYSWFSRVTVSLMGTPIGSITREHHDGVDRFIYTGTPTATNTTFLVERNGYLITFDPSFTGTFDGVFVESGIKKTPALPFVPDMIPQGVFDTRMLNP